MLAAFQVGEIVADEVLVDLGTVPVSISQSHHDDLT
jgi:hypothetical protein